MRTEQASAMSGTQPFFMQSMTATNFSGGNSPNNAHHLKVNLKAMCRGPLEVLRLLAVMREGEESWLQRDFIVKKWVKVIAYINGK